MAQKEETKLSIDDMIVFIGNLQKKTLPELIYEFSKARGYKTNTPKQTNCISNTSNEHMDIKIKNTILPNKTIYNSSKRKKNRACMLDTIRNQ